MAFGNWASARSGEEVPPSSEDGAIDGLIVILWTLLWDVLLLRVWGKHIRPYLDRLSAMPMPPNGIHGWIMLDEAGVPIPPNSPQEPTAQLLFCDGQAACGMMPELLLPRWADSRAWTVYMRPALYQLLVLICNLHLVRVALRYWVFGFIVCLVRPRSRGRLSFLASGVGSSHQLLPVPAVDLGVLEDARDVAALHAAVQTAHDTLEQARQRDGLKYVELLPGLLFQYARPYDYFRSFVGLFGSTYFHMCGTCSMGASSVATPGVATAAAMATGAGSACVPEFAVEPGHAPGNAPAAAAVLPVGSVVDERLRVHGVQGLRVADASIFPAIPTAPTAATCMAVGAAAAEFVLFDCRAAAKAEAVVGRCG